ncbi:MAG: ABC transporter permease [Gemmatimonadaceae bacterium]
MSIVHPLRYASRSLRRTPAFTVTALLTLVIGIAACVAIFAVVHGVLLRPLPYGTPDRLAGVSHDLPPLSLSRVGQTSATYFTYKRFARALEGIGAYDNGAVNVAEPGGGTTPQRITSSWISASVIPLLEVNPAMGRTFTEQEDSPGGPSVVVISDGLWRARFGADPNIIGRTIGVNGITHEIVGVMPRGFQFPATGTELWLPLRLDPNDPNPGGFNYGSVARLRSGLSVMDAQRDLASVLPRMVEISPTVAPGISMQMLLDQAKPSPVITPLREEMTGDIAGTLWMVAAAAGLVLLVACFNVANLILVRADGRQREFAVREALGAGRARVLVHFLAESAVLAAIAGASGLAVAWVAVRALVVAAPVGIPRLTEVEIGAAAVAFTVLIAVFVAVVCSAIPALRIGRVRLSTALRGGGGGGRGGTAGITEHRVRGALVAAQIALALVVLAGSGLLLRTFQKLHAVQPGFDADGVATFWMSLPAARYPDDSATSRFYARLTDRVAGLPGVRAVGISSRLPLVSHGLSQNPFYAEDDPSSSTAIPPIQIFTTVDGGYFRAMGIPLLAGRTFDHLGTQRPDEAVVSQATAEQFWQDPTGTRAVGKRFRTFPEGPWYTVMGVVGNARDTALTAPPSQTVYFPQVPAGEMDFGQAQRTMALVVRTAGEPTAITNAVQRTIRELDPALPTFDVQPMTAVLRASMARLSFVMLILGTAAAVTLVLGAVGLYGVMAYLVTLRSRELGVRIALGAEPRAVAAMMTRQGLALTGIGIVAGLGVFALVARFLRSFLFGVAPSDPVTLVVASLMLVAIALLASWVPARRASRVDPADALRAE